MFRQKNVWCLCIAVMVAVLLSTASAPAEIVTDNLLLYLDAGDADGDGNAGVGTDYSVWKNKAPTGATHDATPNGSVLWAGDGSPADPFVMRFTQTPPWVYESSAQAWATVANSGSGTDLDQSVFTYEVWAEIIGEGTGLGKPSSQYTEAGALITHYGELNASRGNGQIAYSVGGTWIPFTGGTVVPALGLYGGSDYDPSDNAEFPGSVDEAIVGDGVMHHIVQTRAGSGATDTKMVSGRRPHGVFFH